MDIKEFIIKLGEVFEDTDLSTLTPETKFRDLEEWSSVSALSLIAFADDEFDKEIKGNDVREAQTIKDLYHLIAN